MSGRPNVDNLSDADVLDICCGHFARKCSKVEKITIIGWDLRTIGAVPSGFLSQQYQLCIRCRLENNPTEEEVTFFIKSMPSGSAAQMKYIFDFGAFKKEVRLYRTLLPLLCEVVHCEFSPFCYLTKEYNLLAFEDLHGMGYRMATSEGGLLDQQHLVLTLETLASLHAASMILEKEYNCRLDTNYPGYLAENAYPAASTGVKSRIDWIQNSTTALTALIAEIPRYSAWQLNETQKCFAQIVSNIFELCKTSQRYRNVFGHGDLWKNNVMFKYATISDGNKRKVNIPVEAKLVDFQLARYAPPALDVMTICTMTTTSLFRSQKLDELLDTYYLHLSAVLKEHGLSVAVELPRLEFDASCEFYRLAGLIESCLFSHLVLLPDHMTRKIVSGSDAFGDFMSVSRIEMCVTAFRENEIYRSRMTDMIGVIVDEYVLPFMGN